MGKSFLIKDTTREEREKIVKDSLDFADIGCDECGDMYDMYLDYIDGKKELSEITMAYRARYLKDMDVEPRHPCDYEA